MIQGRVGRIVGRTSSGLLPLQEKQAARFGAGLTGIACVAAGGRPCCHVAQHQGSCIRCSWAEARLAGWLAHALTGYLSLPAASPQMCLMWMGFRAAMPCFLQVALTAPLHRLPAFSQRSLMWRGMRCRAAMPCSTTSWRAGGAGRAAAAEPRLRRH